MVRWLSGLGAFLNPYIYTGSGAKTYRILAWVMRPRHGAQRGQTYDYSIREHDMQLAAEHRQDESQVLAIAALLFVMVAECCHSVEG